MKFMLLWLCLTTAALAGANPADYDPYHDNDHDTYHLVSAVMPFKMPQEDGAFTPPIPGPNAQACKDVWDKGVPCPADGLFYGYWGELQPEYCNNNHFMPDGKTIQPEAKKCTCNIAMTKDQKDCPMDHKPVVDGPTCQVYCREKDHCHCVNICDMGGDLGQTPNPAPKSKEKK